MDSRLKTLIKNRSKKVKYSYMYKDGTGLEDPDETPISRRERLKRTLGRFRHAA